MLEPQNHWIYTWLDVNGIDSGKLAAGRLTDRSALSELRELAQLAIKSAPRSSASVGTSILAARGLDFSGKLTCGHFDCRKLEIDGLFRRVWHYFDEIVVDDVLVYPISTLTPRDIKDPFQKWFATNVDIFLYLRSIGASELLSYHPKPISHSYHTWRDVLKYSNNESSTPVIESIIQDISNEAKFEILSENSSRAISLSHPLFQSNLRAIQSKDAKRMSTRSRRSDAIERAVYLHVSEFYGDLHAARELKIPLGSSLPMYQRIFEGSSQHTSLQDVAFALDLPVLSGVGAADIVRLRYYERESFERFQSRLSQGITEYIKNNPDGSASSIAQEIKMDLIEPELRKIRGIMTSAADAFTKKSLFAVGVSALSTLVGVSAGLAWGGLAGATAVGGGALAAGAALNTAFAKKADTVAEMKASDMWFLWKALEYSEG